MLNTLCQPLYKYPLFIILVYILLSYATDVQPQKAIILAILITVLYIIFDTGLQMTNDRAKKKKINTI